MELKKILAGLEGLKVRGNLELDIENIRNNSKDIRRNDMFVAIKGFDSNGHEHILEAIENGANVILAQIDEIDKDIIKKIPEDVTLVLCENTRYALAISACNFLETHLKK